MEMTGAAILPGVFFFWVGWGRTPWKGTYPVEGDVSRGRGQVPWKKERPHVENILKKPLYFARVNIYDYKYYGLFITFEIRGYYGCAGSKGFRTEGANFI